MALALALFEAKLPGLGVGLWDLGLAAAVVALALRPATWRNRVPALDLALLMSLLALAAWAAFGVLRGGDARQAQTQLNALLRMYFLYFAIHAAFRSSLDAMRLACVILAAALYRALGCLVFYFLYVRAGAIHPYPETITDHHDSVLWVTALVGLASFVLVSRNLRGQTLAALVALFLLLAILYNDRRIAWVELVGGLALLYVGMSTGRLKASLRRRALVALPLAALYVLVGWGRPQKVFAPVERLRSALTDETDASNDARALENRGLIITLQSRKLLGSGFGHPFTEVSLRYSAGMERVFPSYRYLPHNSLLGLAAFTGLIGFSLIWTFVPVTAFAAARAFPRASNAREQALSLVAFAAPFIYSAQAFGDMGLQSLKANVILAACTATAARLLVGTGAWPKRGARVRRYIAEPEPALAQVGDHGTDGRDR